MGDGKILLKILRDTSLNKNLSNEPNFGLIHLAGQYSTFKINSFVKLSNNQSMH